MAVRDLQGCAKLLSHIMLETDGRQKPPVGQGRFGHSGIGIKKDKMSKAKQRKSTTERKRGPLKPDVDEIDENIQRMIRIKRAHEGHPVLNDRERVEQEIPERDTGVSNTSGLNAPYNQRLASSTPQGTPIKTMGKANVEGLLKGDVDEHALNSFEFIQAMNPSSVKETGPTLTQGEVDFQPNPLQTFPPRSAFMQQHLHGMREAYMQNIHGSNKTTHNTHTLVGTRKTLLGGLPSTIPAPIVLSASQPIIYPHISQPVAVSTGPDGVYTYSHPQMIQNSQPEHRPSTLRESNYNEPPERDNAQYSLYSSNETNNTEQNDEVFKEKSSEVDKSLVEKRPISPFKVKDTKTEITTTESKGCQTTRAEILQSALKIALDDNGYIKSGPISPFKPGMHGFSGFSKQSQYSEYSQDGTNDIVFQDDIGIQTENIQTDDGESTLVESARSRETSPENKVKKKSNIVNRLTKSTASSEVKRVTGNTKNKKVQFVPGKRKTKEIKARKNGSNGTKVVKATNKVSKAVDSDKKSKFVLNETSKVRVKTKQPSTKDIEEDKENLNPVDKEMNSSPSMNRANYNGLVMKVQHLVQELKSVKLDKEGKRLLKELDDTVQAGNLSWQTDLDLTVQPLRSENAQLRRRIRILTQQMKDKEIELQNAEKPDQGFMVVHLQMKVFNLENEIKALKQLNLKLKEEVKVYLLELERMSADKAQMLNLFGDKVKVTSDKGTLSFSARTEAESYRREKYEWEKEKTDMKNEIDLMTVQYKQKGEELVKMQELVRNLQGSMNRLLEDLQSTKPCPSSSLTRLNKELQHVESIMCEQNPEKSTQSGSTSSRLARSASLRTSSRPIEPFRPRPTRSISADRKLATEVQSPRRNVETKSNIVTNPVQYSSSRSQSQTREPLNTKIDEQRDSHDSAIAMTWKPMLPAKEHGNKHEEIHYQKPRPVSDFEQLNRESSSVDVRKYAREPVFEIPRETVTDAKKNNESTDIHTFGKQSNDLHQRGDYNKKHEYQGHKKNYQRETHKAVEMKQVVNRDRHHSADRKHREDTGIPATHPYQKVGLFLMDEPGLNYRKMAENFSDANRVSMSTNPETDITEYNVYPGMSPFKGRPFEKLDPFIKDLLSSQKMRDGETATHTENRFKSPSESALPGHHKEHTPTLKSEDMNYAPGSLQTLHYKGQDQAQLKDTTSRVSESKETVSSAPTVKELLTPIADRMERFKNLSDVDKSRAVRAINFDEPPANTRESGINKSETDTTKVKKVADDLDDTYNVDLEGEIDKLQYEVSSEDASTTFSERSDQQVASDDNHVNNNESQAQSDSRYSVTDYFKKYPQERKPIQPVSGNSHLDHSNIPEETNQLKLDLSSFQDGDDKESNGSGSLIDVHRHTEELDPPPGMDSDYWAEKVLISPHGIPMIFDDSQDDGSTDFNSNDAVAHTFRSLKDLQEAESLPGDDEGSSPQQKLYHGTDLDTSLSSINELESVDTVTTTTSISSVDDRVFRQGLANLDANIARVQKSLRQKMY